MAYTTIDDPTAYFQCKLFTGNASSNAITFDGNTNMQPDFVWVKSRSQAYGHMLYNSVSGVGKYLSAESNAAENANAPDTLTAFGSNGFTLDDQDNANYTNGGTGVAWNWKESADAGFDIVTYTGNQTARTISHNLGAVPKMMIVKTRSTTGNWGVYHVGLGTANKRLELDSSAAADTGTSVWNDTDPTSSVFSVGNNDRITNGNGMTYVAYLFAEKQGYSKFGSYTGNGNADGTFVYTGFKPAWFMMKNTASGNNWHMMDNKRDSDNVVEQLLKANASDAENTTSGKMDFLSNGVKIRSTSTGANGSGATYIYMAFAENPFVTSTGVPATAR